jgi:hypothetical protein
MNDLDRDSQALLRASRGGDEPSELERSRVRRKLMAAIGGAAVAGSASTAHASAHAAQGAAKLGLGAGGKLAVSLLVAAAAASGVAVWSSARVHAPVSMAAPAHPTAPAPIVTAPVQVIAKPASVAVEVPDAPRAQTHAARAQERARAASAASHERPHAIAPATDALPSDDEPAAADVLAPQAPPATQAPLPGAQDALSRELALISQAQRAVRAGQSERALQLLQRHAAQFPAGALLQERFATQALALCALGRVAEGQRAIGELARISASSPLLGSVRHRCAAAAAPR